MNLRLAAPAIVVSALLLFPFLNKPFTIDDPLFVRKVIKDFGIEVTEEQFQRILTRARAAVASYYGRHYLNFDEFRSIVDGVVLGSRG